MIGSRLEQISRADIQQLLDNGVPESRTLEYKRELPGGSDVDKREFLADVSALANTSGGDLLYGIEAKQGVAVNVCGIQSPDFDLEIQRLENLARDGLEPRISCHMKRISFDSKDLLLIRADRSWTGAHRVIFRGHAKFYGRNSTGKYALNT